MDTVLLRNKYSMKHTDKNLETVVDVMAGVDRDKHSCKGLSRLA